MTTFKDKAIGHARLASEWANAAQATAEAQAFTSLSELERSVRMAEAHAAAALALWAVRS